MTGTNAHEYQNLECDSSNRLLERDAQQVLGRYEEAADHTLQAGRGRVRMGQLCFEAAAYPEAVEDWLSAAECFLQATAAKQAADVLELLHRVEAAGTIPPERPDLRAVLQQRAQGLRDLHQKIQEFRRRCDLHRPPLDVADAQTLRWLLQHVRDLPGLPWLHEAISRLAAGLGQPDLAAAHRAWAATFDPDHANGKAGAGPTAGIIPGADPRLINGPP
jgi:hypothetical protein